MQFCGLWVHLGGPIRFKMRHDNENVPELQLKSMTVSLLVSTNPINNNSPKTGLELMWSADVVAPVSIRVLVNCPFAVFEFLASHEWNFVGPELHSLRLDLLQGLVSADSAALAHSTYLLADDIRPGTVGMPKSMSHNHQSSEVYLIDAVPTFST